MAAQGGRATRRAEVRGSSMRGWQATDVSAAPRAPQAGWGGAVCDGPLDGSRGAAPYADRAGQTTSPALGWAARFTQSATRRTREAQGHRATHRGWPRGIAGRDRPAYRARRRHRRARPNNLVLSAHPSFGPALHVALRTSQRAHEAPRWPFPMPAPLEATRVGSMATCATDAVRLRRALLTVPHRRPTRHWPRPL